MVANQQVTTTQTCSSGEKTNAITSAIKLILVVQTVDHGFDSQGMQVGFSADLGYFYIVAVGCFLVHGRAVKIAEKLKSSFLLKYDQYSNYFRI